MNYLDKLATNIRFNRKKQKSNNIKSFWALGVVSLVIGGAVVAFFTKGCCEEIKSNDINNVEKNDGDINEDTKINREEIRETLENAGEESIGDVGVAIEHALEDEDENGAKS